MNSWFHISDSWDKPLMKVKPKIVRPDDSKRKEFEKVPCICVAPSIRQCLIALGEWEDYSIARVYMALGEPLPAKEVFDFELTNEHRFYEEKTFQYVGSVDIHKTLEESNKIIYNKVYIKIPDKVYLSD